MNSIRSFMMMIRELRGNFPLSVSPSKKKWEIARSEEKISDLDENRTHENSGSAPGQRLISLKLSQINHGKELLFLP